MPRGEKHRAKTHCPRGHEYAGDNLYWNARGDRQCRACRRDNHRRYYRERHGCDRPAARNTIAGILQRLVLDPNGCLVWPGRKNRAGYADVSYDGRVQKVHRLLYEALVGPVPRELDLHHVCGNKGCANVLHLQPMSRRDHLRIGDSPAGRNARATHCPAGHPYEGENLRLNNGHRVCRACSRIRDRARRQAREE